MKKHKRIYIITGVILLAAAVLSVLLMMPSEHMTVEIVQENRVIQTIDLTHAKDQDIRIESPDGTSYNIISIKDGQISVSEAGCPDQTCVHMGALRSDYLPIVCLPNKLIVRFAEGSGSE